MNQKRKRVWILTGFLLAVLLAGYLVLLSNIDPWVSPAKEPRKFGDLEFFTDSETPVPTTPPALKGSEVERKETKEKLSFLWQDTKQRWRRSQIERIPPSFVDNEKQMVSLPGGGRIRLAWAAMGYQPDLDDFPTKEPFTPSKAIVRGDTWEALGEAGFRQYQEEQLGVADAVSPYISKWRKERLSFDLHFVHEGLPDFRTVGSIELMNLDTATKVDWNSGGSINSFRERHFHTMPAIGVFHPARIAAGFDVAYGPFEEAKFSLVAGERATLSDLEMEILSIERFASSMAQRSFPVKRSENKETRSTWFHLDPSRDPMTSIVFSLSPPEMGRFCDIVLVNKAGEEEIKSLRQTYLIDYVSTQTPPEELVELRLRYRPNQARVVFELPPLLGVPEANQEVDNLFDVTIPHFEAKEGWDLRRAISRYAVVQFGIPDAEFPPDYFPRYYENTTSRELLDEYLAHHPARTRIQLDQKTHSIVLPKPIRLEDLWKDFRRWMRF